MVAPPFHLFVDLIRQALCPLEARPCCRNGQSYIQPVVLLCCKPSQGIFGQFPRSPGSIVNIISSSFVSGSRKVPSRCNDLVLSNKAGNFGNFWLGLDTPNGANLCKGIDRNDAAFRYGRLQRPDGGSARRVSAIVTVVCVVVRCWLPNNWDSAISFFLCLCLFLIFSNEGQPGPVADLAL